MNVRWLVALLLSACAPLPATPGPGEMEELRNRASRSRGDVESRLRLAAGLWAQGNRSGAERLLIDAQNVSPEETLYTAALGVVAEASGSYESARALYLAFLDRSAQSAVGDRVAERLRLTRAETATSVVREALATGQAWAHGVDTARAVSILPLRAVGPDPTLRGLAAAATDLLTTDLATQAPFQPLDWEVSAVANRALAPPGGGATDVRAASALLGSHRIVRGEVRRTGADSVVFLIEAYWVDDDAISVVAGGSVRMGLESYAQSRGSVAERVWELLVGGGPDMLPPTYFPPNATVPTEAVIAMGDALLLVETGDRPAAQARLEDARELAPDWPPLLAHIARLQALDEFQASMSLPLAEEMVGLARREAARAALAAGASAGPAGPGSTRHGVGEAFGLDRLGSQVWIDVVIERGASP